jgi:hypothetical protein
VAKLEVKEGRVGFVRCVTIERVAQTRPDSPSASDGMRQAP